jgi:hypothetical protein
VFQRGDRQITHLFRALKDSVSLGPQCYTAEQLFVVKRSTKVMVKESTHALIGDNIFSYLPVISPDTEYALLNDGDLAI